MTIIAAIVVTSAHPRKQANSPTPLLLFLIKILSQLEPLINEMTMTEIAFRSWSFAVCRSGLSPLVVLSERYFLSLVGDVDASLLWGLNLSSFKVVELSVLVLILYGDTMDS